MPFFYHPYSSLSLSLSLSRFRGLCAADTALMSMSTPLFSCSANATANSMALYPRRQYVHFDHDRPAPTWISSALSRHHVCASEDRRNGCGSHARVGWRCAHLGYGRQHHGHGHSATGQWHYQHGSSFTALDRFHRLAPTWLASTSIFHLVCASEDSRTGCGNSARVG